MEAIEFEAQALLAKEDETELFRRRAEIAWVAVNAGPEAKRWLAHLWAISAQTVKRLAQVWDTFPHDDITPDVPLPLYNAALDAAAGGGGDATVWLAEAISEQWSPRQLRDHVGIIKGKHFSDIVFQGHDVTIVEWDIPTGRFAAEGLPLSGKKPERACVTIREVLSKA